MDPNKREVRQTKRAIKKAGNKKRRQTLKRQLRETPEDAHAAEPFDFGRESSAPLNGYDRDSSRSEN